MKPQTTATYLKFEPNQVLTSAQLNQMHQFLDESNRLTRLRLSGAGIVCGLEIDYEPATTKGSASIHISPGYGITSDGYLIEFMGDTFTRFRRYTDLANPPYRFGAAEVNDEDVDYSGLGAVASDTLYELISKNDRSETGEDLKLSRLDGVKNPVVLLLYEFTDESLKACIDSSCENKGKKRVARIRPIITDSKTVFPLSGVRPLAEVLTIADPLSRLAIPRFFQGEELEELSSLQGLQEAYRSQVIVPLGEAIRAALPLAYDVYGSLLSLTPQHLDEVMLIMSGLEAGVENNPAFDPQYTFDMLCDVCQAYNEFADAAYPFYRSCRKSIPPFPRHLVLGQVRKSCADYVDAFRTVYTTAPAEEMPDAALATAQLLFQKMLRLLLCFRVPRGSEGAIRITPDRIPGEPLTKRSIPFYYDPARVATALLPFWDPERTFRGRALHHLAYDAEIYLADIPDTSDLQWPLPYQADACPWFRIEGIHGKDKTEVLRSLDAMKRYYGLDFDVLALPIERTTESSSPDFDFHFEDLQQDYLQLRAALVHKLKRAEKKLAPALDPARSLPELLMDDYLSRTGRRGDETNDYEVYRVMSELMSILWNANTSNFFGEGYGQPLTMDFFAPVYAALPQGLQDFRYYDPFITSYKNLQIRLACCRFVYLRYIDGVRNATYFLDQKGIVSSIEKKLDDYLAVLDEVLGFSEPGGLGIVYTSAQARRKAQQQSVRSFGEFNRHYKGHAHQRGTGKGDTLVLVYSSTEKLDPEGPDQQIVADFSLRGKIDWRNSPLSSAVIEFPPVALHHFINLTVDPNTPFPTSIVIDLREAVYLDDYTSDYHSAFFQPPSTQRAALQLEVNPEYWQPQYFVYPSATGSGELEVSPANVDGLPQLVYKPRAADPRTIDIFRYQVTRTASDGSILQDAALLVIHIVGPPAPVLDAHPDNVTTIEGNDVLIRPLANDLPIDAWVVLFDFRGNPGPQVIETRFGHVFVEANDPETNVVFRYRPDKAQHLSKTETDTFYYQMRNHAGLTSVKTAITVTILPAQQLASDFAAVLTGKSVTIDVLVNDREASGKPLALIGAAGTVLDRKDTLTTAVGASVTVHYSEALQRDVLLYTAPAQLPEGTDTASDSFCYTTGASHTAVVSVSILAAVSPQESVIAASSGKPMTIDVFRLHDFPFDHDKGNLRFLDVNGNAIYSTDRNGNKLYPSELAGDFGIIRIQQNEAHQKILVYTPSANTYNSKVRDTFHYQVESGDFHSGSLSITIEVNAPAPGFSLPDVTFTRGMNRLPITLLAAPAQLQSLAIAGPGVYRDRNTGGWYFDGSSPEIQKLPIELTLYNFVTGEVHETKEIQLDLLADFIPEIIPSEEDNSRGTLRLTYPYAVDDYMNFWWTRRYKTPIAGPSASISYERYEEGYIQLTISRLGFYSELSYGVPLQLSWAGFNGSLYTEQLDQLMDKTRVRLDSILTQISSMPAPGFKALVYDQGTQLAHDLEAAVRKLVNVFTATNGSNDFREGQHDLLLDEYRRLLKKMDEVIRRTGMQTSANRPLFTLHQSLLVNQISLLVIRQKELTGDSVLQRIAALGTYPGFFLNRWYEANFTREDWLDIQFLANISSDRPILSGAIWYCLREISYYW